MKIRERRRGMVLVTSVVALAFAGQAFAALTPSFTATTTGDATVVSYSQGAGDDSPAAITFYVAAGYDALLAQPEGDVVGKATGRAVAADLGGATLALSGPIVAAAATTTITSAGASVPLSAAAIACTGTATHSAFWVLNLAASGQTLQVPAYVDDVPLGTPLAAIANTTIKICLPPADVPAGTPGRATFGAKLVSAQLAIDSVFSAAPGWYLWHATVTPYSPGIGKANAAGTVEVQSLDRTPQQVTLNARAVKRTKKTAFVSGRVSTGERGVSGVDVSILIGKSVVARLKTRAGGVYSQRIILPRAAVTLVATATAALRRGGACTAAFPPIPCAGKWVSGFTTKSPAVRVTT